MGQYLQALAPERKETVSLSGAMKPVERFTNTRAMAELAFLLYDHDAPEEYYDYYGRWAGEDVRLVGDYDDSGLYDEPSPDVEVAPLSNPHLITLDDDTSTAPDPEAVTEDWTVELDHGRMPLIKGSWKGRGCSHPTEEHPDSGMEVGSYVDLRESDDERLDEDTVGVVMSIENDWTDVTDGVHEEMEMLVNDDEIEQDGTALLPKRVLEA